MLSIALVTDPSLPARIPAFVADKPASFSLDTLGYSHVQRTASEKMAEDPPHGTHSHDVFLLDGRLSKDVLVTVCETLQRNDPEAVVLLFLAPAELGHMRLGLPIDDFVMIDVTSTEAATRIMVTRESKKQAQKPAVLRAHNVTLDERNATVLVAEHPVNLTFREFELLRYFLSFPGKTFDRAQLLTAVWAPQRSRPTLSQRAETTQPAFPTEGTVTVHIRRIREKLSAHGAPEDMIRTIWGRGYQLVPEQTGTLS